MAKKRKPKKHRLSKALSEEQSQGDRLQPDSPLRKSYLHSETKRIPKQVLPPIFGDWVRSLLDRYMDTNPDYGHQPRKGYGPDDLRPLSPKKLLSAALMCLYPSLPLKEISQISGASVTQLRVWRTEKRFQTETNTIRRDFVEFAVQTLVDAERSGIHQPEDTPENQRITNELVAYRSELWVRTLLRLDQATRDLLFASLREYIQRERSSRDEDRRVFSWYFEFRIQVLLAEQLKRITEMEGIEEKDRQTAAREFVSLKLNLLSFHQSTIRDVIIHEPKKLTKGAEYRETILRILRMQEKLIEDLKGFHQEL